jgi:predicted secreted protein
LISSVFAAQEAFPIKKEPALEQIKPKKPVKIRLKRTTKDEYSWELSGDDADDIVRTDQRLRKLLNVK